MRVFLQRGYLALLFPLLLSGCVPDTRVVQVAVTSDVHGMIYPYDFISREPASHSLAHIHQYASERRNAPDTLFYLLDNGDFLQGQPTPYYFNFVDTASPHLAAGVMNFMGYDAGTVGNHDIEAGPRVYESLRKQFRFPWLAANAVSVRTGEPVFEPYTVLEAGNRRIAILGLITPGIPKWLPPSLWPGMEFRGMVETAREWVPVIRERENPDLLLGLFHSGMGSSANDAASPVPPENATLRVAQQVPGFDAVFAGHDHRAAILWTRNVEGDSVLVVNPGSHARYAGELTVTFRRNGSPGITARNVEMSGYQPSGELERKFSQERSEVGHYLDDTVTWLTEEMPGREALFGPSALTSLVHAVQLEHTGARVSFTAPLTLSGTLEAGPLRVSDLFRLYRYENMLYTMELTGQEIDRFLEYAAGLWFDTMESDADTLLLYDRNRPGRLAHPYFNFSTAAGIRYTVDVTRPAGERVEIGGFTNGDPFRPEATYRVAINSYRASGGGGHLTDGAGIPRDSLNGRVLRSSDSDIRALVMQSLSVRDTLQPGTMGNWKVLPEAWAERARDREITRFR